MNQVIFLSYANFFKKMIFLVYEIIKTIENIEKILIDNYQPYILNDSIISGINLNYFLF